MDNSNLIDFNKEICENKLLSPLIPIILSSPGGVLSPDTENNPFDNVLRTITNETDPFECATYNNNNKNICVQSDDKENIGKLISPIYTPRKSMKFKKLATSPLLISEKPEEQTNNRLSLPIISKLQNSSIDCNISDTSLQILNDSSLNITDMNFIDVAVNISLPPDSSDECDILEACSGSSLPSTNEITWKIPSAILNESNKLVVSPTSCNSALNNAFIENSDTETIRTLKLSSECVTSNTCIKTPNLFHTESLGASELSNIYPYPSTSSTTSRDMQLQSINELNLAFLTDTKTFGNKNLERKSESAKKSTINEYFNSESGTLKPRNLNRSFGGFNFKSMDVINPYKFSTCDDDSVFMEASYLAETFRSTPPIAIDDEAIINCTPPWLEEDNNVFIDDDDDDDEKEDQLVKNNAEKQDISEIRNTEHNNESLQCFEIKKENTIIEDYQISHVGEQLCPSYTETNQNNENDINNAKDLLQNLSKLMNKSDDVVDQRKLGESLINSLALALNIKNPIEGHHSEEKSFIKMQRSKSDSKLKERNKISSINYFEKKTTLPKLKPQSVTGVKLDKVLKPKTEKEKMINSTNCKGPLKAFIPLANVAKAEKNFGLKLKNDVTPPKVSQCNSSFQFKKTSTPNDLKLKSPMAQSTPDNSTKNILNNKNKYSPLSKRQFGFSFSPSPRPENSNDFNNSLDKSMSPKQNSGSVQNMNTVSNKFGFVTKQSIPKMSRRNSATEITRSNLNTSYENNKPTKPSQLKRSSSFQNKVSSGKNSITSKPAVENNNLTKKYGAPGKIKPLRLVPKK